MSAAGALLLAASLHAPRDEACRAALELSYDGSTGAALQRLDELNAPEPEPLCAYLELLVRVWTLEPAPDEAGDAAYHARARDLIALCDRRLAQDPQDGRARFVRGAASGLQSRLHLARWQKRAAAATAARMRQDLLRVPAGDPLQAEARFGLGLYDYYADVLPRLLKLLRFLTGLPGGDRARGLRALEAAEESAVLHHTEVQAQLFDIYVIYEGRDDDALREVEDLRRRYPGGPLWGLRLCEHQGRLGLYSESAKTARALLAAAEEGRPNHAPVVGGLARVLLAEALLGELDPGAAEEAARPALALPLGPGWAGRARLALGRALEEQGRRGEALDHYRAAEAGGERERAREALRDPLEAGRLQALPLLREGRRLRAAGREREAAALFARALASWPASQEAALRVAEEDLEAGRLAGARARLAPLLAEEAPAPPWVRPWSRLLAARLDDLAGRRAAAVQQYNQVFKQPLGSAALRELAAAGQARPFRRADPPGTDRRPLDHSR